MTLLPPNATPLERALEGATARIADIRAPIDTLLDPAAIRAEWLPWLAWALSVDIWDADWSDATKRAAVAESIALHRVKGTRLSVEMVLARKDALARVVEWHETSPRGAPHTFEVHLPVAGPGVPAGGPRATAAFAEAIIRDVIQMKPLREHMIMVQRLEAVMGVGVQAVARGTLAGRETMAFTDDRSQPWGALLQTEDGEPLQSDDDSFLQETA